MSYITFLTAFLLIFSGCSNKKNSLVKPNSLDDFKELENIKNSKNINATFSSEAKIMFFIDESDVITHICFSNKSECLYKPSSSEAIIQSDYNSFSSDVSTTNSVQCGQGSFIGWPVILGGLGYVNHSEINKKFCSHRFTSLDSAQIFTRTVMGLFTFGTTFITTGTLHSQIYDEEKLKDAIYNSNVHVMTKELHKEYENSLSRAKDYDVVYLDVDDLEDSLLDAYEKSRNSKSVVEGIIFIDKNRNKLISINTFTSRGVDAFVWELNSIIGSIFEWINSSKNKEIYAKFKTYIPKPIELPPLPPVKTMKKDEFEKIKEFEKRVELSVKERENLIASLQRNYTNDVNNRNEYIKKLENMYSEYLHSQIEQKQKFKEEFNENLELLSKLVFIDYITSYDAKNFKYDAEKERLYFDIYTKSGDFVNSAFSRIEPDVAKNIKYGKSEIIPKFDYVNNSLTLKNLYIKELDGSDEFEINYTNIDYIPNSVNVVVENIKRVKKEKNSVFKSFIQEPKNILDNSQKEIWYIDIAKRYDAKVPLWFKNPKLYSFIVGYGTGNSFENAMSSARAELAFRINSKIDSTLNNKDIWTDNYHSNRFENSVNVTTNIELSNNDYEILNQDKVDGMWYVALKYTN